MVGRGGDFLVPVEVEVEMEMVAVVSGYVILESITVHDDRNRSIRKKHTMTEDRMTLVDHELWRPRLVSAPLGTDPVRRGGENGTTRVPVAMTPTDRRCREAIVGGVGVGGRDDRISYVIAATCNLQHDGFLVSRFHPDVLIRPISFCCLPIAVIICAR